MKIIMWVKIKMLEKVFFYIKKCDISYSFIGKNLYFVNEIFNFYYRFIIIIFFVYFYDWEVVIFFE